MAACSSSDDDYAVTASWLINGLAPDEALCATYEVESVRLTIEGKDGGRSLTADCTERVVLSDGFDYGGFTTTQSFEFGKSYRYQIDMLDDAGNSVAGYEGSFEAQADNLTPVELPPLELFWPHGDQATLFGRYSLEGDDDLAQACESAEIERVEIWVASVTDVDLVDAQPVLSSACSEGELGSDEPVLAIGDYQLLYVALDAEDRVVTQSESFPATVDGPVEVTLPDVRLSAP
jgi:hypothetical protein